MSRKSTGKKLRFEVLKRDGFTCQYCGAHPPQVLLVVDHVTPVCEGGDNNMDNLVAACEPCNQGKGGRPLAAVPESLSSKADRIAEAEEQIRGYQDVLRARAARLESETWEVAEVLWPGSSEKGARRDDLVSIKKFIEKVGVVPVLEVAEVTRARAPAHSPTRYFRYFCACGWNLVRQAEGQAQ